MFLHGGQTSSGFLDTVYCSMQEYDTIDSLLKDNTSFTIMLTFHLVASLLVLLPGLADTLIQATSIIPSK